MVTQRVRTRARKERKSLRDVKLASTDGSSWKEVCARVMWYAKCVEAVQELRWCYMPASLFWILLRFDESIRMLQSHLAAEDLGLADDKLYIQTAVENCNEQQDTHVSRAHRDGYWTGSSLEPKLLQGRELLARCHPSSMTVFACSSFDLGLGKLCGITPLR